MTTPVEFTDERGNTLKVPPVTWERIHSKNPKNKGPGSKPKRKSAVKAETEQEASDG